MRLLPKIPNNIITHEYIFERLSIPQIAEKYNVPTRTVRRRLHNLNIPLRYELRRITITKDILEKEYILNDLSVTQIAEKYKISASGVYNKLILFKIPMKAQCIDLTGQFFGDLVVLEKVKSKYESSSSASWKCLCKCGNTIVTMSTSLRKGYTTCCGCSWQTAFKDIPGSYISRIKRGALSRNLGFNISNEELWNLYIKQNKKCALSDVDIVFYTIRTNLQTASLDRIDSSKGYTVDNVQWVHKDINRMKSNFSEERFLYLIKHIYENKKLNQPVEVCYP